MEDCLNCPRCQETMDEMLIDDVVKEYSVYSCSKCEGIWFTKSSELNEISKVADLGVFEFTHLPTIEKQMEPLNCPSCPDNQLMDKIEHKRDRRVIMDVCPQCHGVWLDKGELEAIQKESWGSLLMKLYKWLVKKDYEL